ncbi:transglutaminase family protein [Chamaesiphon sp.]|uniref:transglutaminase-like domain-containing protein n=1 Tax=Chamaesiphon sp. TaxID=2814140 RepID=UPI00359367AB
MLKYELGCVLNYIVSEPSTLIFNIGVVSNDYQTIVTEELHHDVGIKIEEYVTQPDRNRCFRLNVSPGAVQISYRAIVELTHYQADPIGIYEVLPADLPLDILPYLYPSRYCQSDRLLRLAESEFGDLVPGYARVTAICNWIYDRILYRSGSSDAGISACDTVLERVGVCRDFAHLGIAFCRASNIPARFVSGYAYGLNPPDFHAWFEAYLGDRWYTFDPTRLSPQTGLVRVGTGRDAADVSFANIFGAVQMSQMQLFMNYLPDVQSSVTQMPLPTTEAISIA